MRSLIVLFFQIIESNNYLYYKRFDDQYVILCLYIDDILILSSDLDLINDVKKFLSDYFNMKDIGEVNMILGMKIIRSLDSISLS